MGQGTGPLCTAGGSPGWVRHWEQSDLCRGQRPAAAAATEDMNYIEVMRCYSGHFERMTRGNYQRWEQGQRGLRPSQAQHHASTTKTTPDCCPACGSIDIKKSGKTLANTQRWACKDCGKKFV